MSRRSKVVAAGTVVAALALAACGSSGSGTSSKTTTGPSGSSTQAVNLTFWSWVPGISASVNLWNRTHPDIHVALDEVTSGNAGTYAKMFSALQAGNAPDLGQIEYATLPNFEHVDGVLDLSKYGASSVQSDFVPWTWSQVSQGGGVYAIPQDTGPMGLFYRSDVFAKYGLSAPTTWTQYMADAETIHQKDPGAYIAAFPANDAQWFAGLAWQAGARLFDIKSNSWVVSIDSPAAVKVADFWQQMISKGLVKVEPDFANAWYKDLADGTVLTWPTAVWGENTILTNAASTAGKWRVAAMPQWSSQTSDGNWGGSSTVVFKDTKHPAQAAEFAEWLNTDIGSIKTLVSAGGLYPADKAGQSIPEDNSPVSFYGNQNIWQVFRTASANVNTDFVWGPIMSTTFTQMANAFGASTGGSGSLAADLSTTQAQTLSTMKQQGFAVTAG